MCSATYYATHSPLGASSPLGTSVVSSITHDIVPAFLIELFNLVLRSNEGYVSVPVEISSKTGNNQREERANKRNAVTHLECKQVSIARRRCKRAHALRELVKVVLCVQTVTSLISFTRWWGGKLQNKEGTCLVATRGTNRTPDMYSEGIKGFRTNCGRAIKRLLPRLFKGRGSNVPNEGLSGRLI